MYILVKILPSMKSLFEICVSYDFGPSVDYRSVVDVVVSIW